MARAIDRPPRSISGATNIENLSKLLGQHDLSLKIPFANPESPDAIQVVLENPNHETADVRIIFHLDDPSKITGGGALGIDIANLDIPCSHHLFAAWVIDNDVRFLPGVATLLRNISNKKPSGLHLQLSFLSQILK